MTFCIGFGDPAVVNLIIFKEVMTQFPLVKRTLIAHGVNCFKEIHKISALSIFTQQRRTGKELSNHT